MLVINVLTPVRRVWFEPSASITQISLILVFSSVDCQAIFEPSGDQEGLLSSLSEPLVRRIGLDPSVSLTQISCLPNAICSVGTGVAGANSGGRGGLSGVSTEVAVGSGVGVGTEVAVGSGVGVGTEVAVGSGTEVGIMTAIAVAATAVDIMELGVLVADIAAAMVASTFGVAVGSGLDAAAGSGTGVSVGSDSGVDVATGAAIAA